MTFRQFLVEFDFNYNGIKVGTHASVNKPDDEHHGKTGRVVRQLGTEYAIELHHTPGKVHWYHASHLRANK